MAQGSALAQVYTFYDLQEYFVRLLKLPREMFRSAKVRSEAAQNLRKFTAVKREVERRHRAYLGGDEVLQAAEAVRSEVMRKFFKK